MLFTAMLLVVGVGLQVELISSKLCSCSSGNLHGLEGKACLSRDTGGKARIYSPSHGGFCALPLNCGFPCLFLSISADEEVQPPDLLGQSGDLDSDVVEETSHGT